MTFRTYKQGFTLIELLVVIAIIALLSTSAAVAVNTVRVKARDTKRLSDLKQMAKALELFRDSDLDYMYPINESQQLGVEGAECLDLYTGWNSTGGCDDPVMAVVPAPPGVSEIDTYTYVSTDGFSYYIAANLEDNIQGMQGGIVYTNDAGVWQY